MILVDTSVWIDHLRSSEPELVSALNAGQILMHPFVVGELACGKLRNRQELLSLLRNLPEAPVATQDQALSFIDQHRLMGRGIGYIDAHLLAATALGPSTRIWTRDKRLTNLAIDLNLNFVPVFH